MGVLSDAASQKRRKAPEPPEVVEGKRQIEAEKFTDAVGGEGAAVQQDAIKKQGENILAKLRYAGVTSGPRWESAATMATQGFNPDVVESPWMDKAVGAVGWLDKLGALVRFGVADIFGIDQAAGVGGRDGSEITGQDYKDIWGGNFDSIVARHGAEVVGEEGRMSGGQILNNIGWDTRESEDPNPFNRFMHGVAGFGLELATDPLTYVTGGLAGVGKKTALVGAEKLTSGAMAKVVANFLKGSTDDALEHAFERGLAARLRPLANDALTQAAHEAGEELTESAAEAVVRKVAADIADEELVTVGKAIAKRDFGALTKDFRKYADANKMGYLGGGLRVGANPVTGLGWRLPGTAGKGRSLTRTIFGTSVGSEGQRGWLGLSRTLGDYGESGIRGFLDRKWSAGSKWEGMLRKIGVENDMLAAFKAGKPEAAKLLRTAVGAQRKAATSGVGKAFGRLGVASEVLGKAMRQADLGKADVEDFMKEILTGLHSGRLGIDAIVHPNAEIQAAAREFGTVWTEAFETTARVAEGIGLNFGNRKNYIPFVRGKKLGKVFQDMTDKGVAIPVLETMTDEEKLGAQLANEMLASWQRRIKSGRKAIGESEYMTSRELGMTIKVTDVGETTLFEVVGEGSIEVLDPVAMNELMTAALEKVARENQIVIPKDFSVLDMNPFSMADQYLSSMGAAINEKTLLDEAMHAGLLKNAVFKLNKGKMAANLLDQFNNLNPRIRTAIEQAIDDADAAAAALGKNATGPIHVSMAGMESLDDEILLGVMNTQKMATVKLGPGVTMDVPESVMSHPQVVKLVEEAKDFVKLRLHDRRVVQNNKKKMVKALKRQGLPEDLANVMADATSIEPINALRTGIEHAMAEEAEAAMAGTAEMAARKVVESKEALQEAMAMLAAARLSKRRARKAARKRAEEAIIRTRRQAGSKPVRVARIEDQLGQAAIADQIKPSAVARMEGLAQWADQIKGGGDLAAVLREIAEFMGEAGVSEKADLDRILRSIRVARRYLDTLNGDTGSVFTFREWLDYVPKRKTRMKRSEQERLIDELVNDPMVKTPKPPGPEITTPQELANAQQVWFAAFADMHGVDPRNLFRNDRQKLKILLGSGSGTTGSAKAVHAEARQKILTIPGTRADSLSSKRSLQAMLIDIAEETGASGPGKARPDWTQFNYEAARAMTPDDFFAAYGEMFARVGTRRANGTIANESVEAALESHKIIHQMGFVGKTVDDALSGTIERDFKLLEALYEGKDVWRDVNLREDLLRLFSESSMSAEYRLTGARGGRFQLESLEEVTTLTSTQLKRELRLAGWTESIEEAQQAIARGELSVAGLSQAAKDTLAAIPTADARALDELTEATNRAVASSLVSGVRRQQVAVKEAVQAQKQLEKLSQLVLKRDASGKMPAYAVKQAQAILDNQEYMRSMRKILPREDWVRIDQVRQSVRTATALRNVEFDPLARDLIHANNQLRNDLMFDPVQARESLEKTVAQIERVRVSQALEGAEGEVAVFARVAQILRELMGMAPDPTTGLTRPMWATAEELADDIHPLILEGKRLSKRLGWDDVTDILEGLEKGAAVPTAETANFIPIQAFDLTGQGIEGQLVDADFGRFMEHTMRSMLAMQTPTGLEGFMRSQRQILHWWKGMATVARPTFHIRNFLSAGWNNSMIDVRMGDYKFVARHMRELQRHFKETGNWVEAAGRMSDEKARFYFREAALSGVMDNTFSNSEMLGKAARRATASKLARANPLSTHGPLLNVGGHTMENIEGFMRLAAFIRHMPEELMGSADEALLRVNSSFANEMVNMVHFDYKNLTAAEEWVKQFVPFFVWTRRNMPLQMRTLIERPGIIARYSHLVASANDEMGAYDDVGPRRYGGSTFIGTDIVLNEDTSFWSRLIIDPDIPVKDLFALEDPFEVMSYVNLAASMLGPHLSEPLEAAFGEHYETNAPVGWYTIVKSWNAFNDPDVELSDNYAKMDSAVASLMRTLFPPASEFLTAFEQDPGRMMKLGITDGDLMSRVRAGAMDLALPGLGVAGYTPDEEYRVYTASQGKGSAIVQDMYDTGMLDASSLEGVEAYLKQLKQSPTLDAGKFKEFWERRHPPAVDPATEA